MTLRFLSAMLLGAALITSCRDEPSAIEPAPDTVAKTDLVRLAELIHLPRGVEDGKWTVRPIRPGGSRVPGPTDTILLAYLKLSADGWKELTLGESKAVDLRTQDARALMPQSLLEGQNLEAETVQISCRQVKVDLAKAWDAQVSANRCGDGLLAVFRSK